MTPANLCPTDADLRAFARGATAAPTLAAHLSVCPACLRRLDALRSSVTVGPDAAATPGAPQIETVAQTGPTPTDDPPADHPPESFGRYRVKHALGAGGMGAVYAAEDPAIGRLVAVKVPRREWFGADPEQAQARFLREVRSAARVRHPNVCAVHDVGTHDGLPYLVLDLIEGPSLRDRLRDGSPVEPRQAAEWVRQLAEALAAVHAAGMSHRDVKPANVLLAPDGRAVLTDFGIARPDDAEQLTADGLLVGTPAYLAPERLAGEGGGPRGDLYALGLVLYQLLTGDLPADRAAPVAPSQVRPGLDPRLDGPTLRAIAARPEQRYASAREFADDLARCLGQQAAPAPQNRPATVRVELPDGRPVTVQVAEGVPEGGKVKVDVRERRSKSGKTRWAVSVTVTFVLLVAVSATVLYRSNPLAVLESARPPDVALKDKNGGDKDKQDDKDKDKQTELAKAEEWKALQDKLTRVRTPRVAVSYDVETNGAQQTVELPFVIAVLADLSGSSAKPRPPLKNRHVHQIDRDNFDYVMKALSPRVSLPQVGGPPVVLSFSRLEDFDPTEVRKRVPPSLRDQLAKAVLNRPEYRRLESSWRGLRFLVMNAETSQSLKVRVLDVTAKEMADDLAKADDPADSALYRKLYTEEAGQIGGQPYALLVGDQEFGPGDLKLLSGIGAVAQRAQAPFVAAAAPSLLGATSYSELPPPKTLDANAGRTGWKEYRQTEAARWTALALPRVAARPATDGESEPLWMSAAWAFAVEAADAEAKHGWPGRLSAQSGSRVNGLPLWKPAKGAPRPTDADLTPAQGFDLADRGLMPLLPLDDKGDAAFVDARSCHDPRGDVAASRLPTLLCAGHASRILAVQTRDKIGAFQEREDVEKWLNRWLGKYQADGEIDAKARARKPFADAKVEVREVKGRPGQYEVIVTLRPLHQLDPPPKAPLRLVVPIPKGGQ